MMCPRFKKGGNAGDITIAAGGQQYAAAFGDGDERDWRSSGHCFIYVSISTVSIYTHCIYTIHSQQLSASQPVYVWMRSGGGSDCVEETSWRYGIMSVHLIAQTT